MWFANCVWTSLWVGVLHICHMSGCWGFSYVLVGCVPVYTMPKHWHFPLLATSLGGWCTSLVGYCQCSSPVQWWGLLVQGIAIVSQVHPVSMVHLALCHGFMQMCHHVFTFCFSVQFPCCLPFTSRLFLFLCFWCSFTKD